MRKLLLIILISLIFISSCLTKPPEIKVECTKDSDCTVAGCSGQICIEKNNIENRMTTCEFRPEHTCLKETQCLCISNKCRFEENKNYLNCLNELKK
jgi:eight-cysteine-cluster-containing protein